MAQSQGCGLDARLRWESGYNRALGKKPWSGKEAVG